MLNERREVLVVQERTGPLRGKGVWKLPTGLVDAGEDLHRAVEREARFAAAATAAWCAWRGSGREAP